MCVRKISGGVITTVAGSGTSGFAGDGGSAVATSCQLFHPQGVAVDGSGNVYISDAGNNRIREVDASFGNINTIAGTGTGAYSGEGTATSVNFNAPCGLAINGTNMYVADAGNNRIRIINLTAGTTSSFAGVGIAGNTTNDYAPAVQLRNPTGVFLDPLGNVWIADRGNNRIW